MKVESINLRRNSGLILVIILSLSNARFHRKSSFHFLNDYITISLGVLFCIFFYFWFNEIIKGFRKIS